MSSCLPPPELADADSYINLEHSCFSMSYRKPQYPVTLMMPYVGAIRGPVVASMLYYAKHLDIGFDLVGNTLIQHARNQLAENFLRSKAEWSFWVDSDVFMPFGKADTFRDYTGMTKGQSFAEHNTLTRLLGHKEPLVGGVYAGRLKRSPMTIQPDLQPRSNGDKRVANAIRDGKSLGLQPVNWLATGLMLAHRSVFERIREHFPFEPPYPGAYYPFFRVTDHMGEDVYFCHQARSVGIQPLLDTEIRAGHIGESIFMPEDSSPPVPLGGLPQHPAA